MIPQAKYRVGGKEGGEDSGKKTGGPGKAEREEVKRESEP